MRGMLALGLYLAVVGCAHALTPYEAEYEVRRNGKPVGSGTVTLAQREPGVWELHALTRGSRGFAGLAGLEISERSRLRQRDGHWQTLSYDYRMSAAWRTRERSVRIDPGAARILSSDRDRRYEFALQPDVLDRQGVTLALAEALAAGERGDLEFLVVDRDELEPQRYRTLGEETLQTPAGTERTLRVERIRAAGSPRRTVTWFGIERGFVPVRVLQEDADGDRLELDLRRLRRDE